MAGTRDQDKIESIGSDRAKSPAWWMAGDEVWSFDSYPPPAKAQKTSSVDSISSAQPVLAQTNTQVALNTEEAKTSPYSVSGIVNIGRKVWEFLCTPVSFSTAATGTSNKPGGDSVTGIGSPSLEPPFQMDVKAFQNLIDELRSMIHQIKETNNESEDAIKDSDRGEQAMLMLIAYMKKQRAIRENGALDTKALLSIYQVRIVRIRKEQGDADSIRSETEASRNSWTSVNNGVTAISVAVTALAVGLVVASTFGGGMVVIPTMIQITMSITQCAVGLASGGSQLMKSMLDKKYGEIKERTVVLGARHVQVMFVMRDKVDKMHESYLRAEELSKQIAQLLRNFQEAGQAVNART